MGHGHDHHEFKVPDYRIYKVSDVPLLVNTQNALKAQGLSDPWLRNEVWRYNVKQFGTEGSRAKSLFFRGFKWGFLAFVATAIGGYAMDKASGGHDHGHH